MDNKNEIVAVLLTIMAIFSFIGFGASSNYEPLNKNDFTQISGTLEGYEAYNSKNNSYIKVILKEYNVNFSINSTALGELNRIAFVETIKKGDKINLVIRKQDLTNLSKFDDDCLWVSIYGLSNQSYEYISLERIEKAHQNSASMGLFIGYFFLIIDIAILTYLVLRKYLKKKVIQQNQ